MGLVGLVLLMFLLLPSCAKYVWYNPYKTPDEQKRDYAQCKFEATRYALGMPPPNINVVNTAPPVTESGGVIYVQNPQAGYSPYTQAYTTYGIMIGLRKAEYFRACMEALGYTKVREDELEKKPQTTPHQ